TAASPAALQPATAATATIASDRPIASPSVRRRAWELGIDLAQVRASGTAGRVTQADLDAHAQAHPAAAPSAGGVATPAARVAAPPAAPSGTPRDGVESIAVIGLRRKIALKMQDAKRRIPHFSYVEECDVTELEALRDALNAQHAPARGKLTLLPFLM